MTVSSTSSRVVYAGNASTTAFPFAFKVLAGADLVVIYTDASGNQTTLTSGQYVDTNSYPTGDAGGTITYNPNGSPIPLLSTLTIYRNEAATQPTQISNQGAMWPAVIEQALDRLTLLVQQFIDGFNRSLRISPTDGPTLNLLPVAAQRANSVLGFDGAGQPYAATLVSSLAGVATWLFDNFLQQATSAASACAALGAAFLTGNNAFTGTNTFPTQAASDNSTRAATTAMVQAAIAAMGGTIGAAGSYTLPNGLILKWGTSGSVANAGNATITFATAFPTALFGVVLSRSNASGSSQAADYWDTGLAASFKIHNQGTNSGTFFWVALGN